MKNKLIRLAIAFAVLFLGQKTFAFDSTINPLKTNVLFVTFGGKENFGSVNYEHIFSTDGKLNWSYSVGVQPFQPAKKFSLPVSINAFTKGRLHHFEVDVTATFYMAKPEHYVAEWQNDFNKQVYLSPFLCYRLQGKSGIVIKTGVGPQVLFDPPSDDVSHFKTKLLRPSVFGSIGLSF